MYAECTNEHVQDQKGPIYTHPPTYSSSSFCLGATASWFLLSPIFSSSCIPTSSLSSNSIPWSFFDYDNPEIIELFPSLRVLEACLTFYNSNKKYGLQYWKVLSSIKQTYKNYNATIISYSFIHNNEKDSHSFDRIKTLDSCDLKRICDFFKRLLNLPDSFVVIGNA